MLPVLSIKNIFLCFACVIIDFFYQMIKYYSLVFIQLKTHFFIQYLMFFSRNIFHIYDIFNISGLIIESVKPSFCSDNPSFFNKANIIYNAVGSFDFSDILSLNFDLMHCTSTSLFIIR